MIATPDGRTDGTHCFVARGLMAVIELTGKNWQQEVEKSDLPVFVDFYTEWCVPCKAIAPILEELSDDYKGRMKFGRLDIEKQEGFAIEYGVMSVPMLIIFFNGKMIAGRAGATDKGTFKRLIDATLAEVRRKVEKKMPKTDMTIEEFGKETEEQS